MPIAFEIKQTFFPNPYTQRGSATKIGISPDGDTIAYGAGTNVIVRSVKNPSQGFVYYEHRRRVTVVRFSPNGHYMASGDNEGKLRVWALDNDEHTLKKEMICSGIDIRDLAWDSESKRIAMGGDGHGRMIRAFMWDTGSDLGEFTGHSRGVNSVDFRPCRPFRLVSSSDDMLVSFYQGPPFKFDHSDAHHKNFVHAVRYSPDGAYFVSVSGDKTIDLFEGKTGEFLRTISAANGHSKGLYGVGWEPDSKHIYTVSADCTVKYWNVESGECEATLPIGDGKSLEVNQLGLDCLGELRVSLSFNSDLNVIEQGATGYSTIVGHQGAVNTCSFSRNTGTVLTSGSDGRVIEWSAGRGRVIAHHKGNCNGAVESNGACVSIGWDDTVRFTDLVSLQETAAVKLDEQPMLLRAAGENVVVIAANHIYLFREQQLVDTLTLPQEARAGDMDECGLLVAVAVEKQRRECVEVYSLDTGKIQYLCDTANHELDYHRSRISVLRFSPDGAKIAVGDAGREIKVWEIGKPEPVITRKWMAHQSTVTTICWAPEGDRLVSGSVDGRIVVWNMSKPREINERPQIHPGGVFCVDWA
ncbi:hypothetical protein WA577_001528, partial [Blastocystis sp. JDR]